MCDRKATFYVVEYGLQIDNTYFVMSGKIGNDARDMYESNGARLYGFWEYMEVNGIVISPLTRDEI